MLYNSAPVLTIVFIIKTEGKQTPGKQEKDVVKTVTVAEDVHKVPRLTRMASRKKIPRKSGASYKLHQKPDG